MNSLNRLIKIANYFQFKLAKSDHKLTEDQITQAIQLGIRLAENQPPVKNLESKYPEIPDQDPESDARKICAKVKERVGLGIQQLTNSLSEYFHQNPINPKQESTEESKQKEESDLLLAVASDFSLPDELLDILSSSADIMFSAAVTPVSSSLSRRAVTSLCGVIRKNPELENDSDFLNAYCYAFPFVLSGFISQIINQNQ